MVANSYRPERDVSEHYLSKVSSWLRVSGEVFVVLRYLRAAGAKEYAFVRSDTELADLIRILPLGTDIIAFHDPQLPMRGVVDAAFIDQATEHLAEWKEYLYVVIKPQ